MIHNIIRNKLSHIGLIMLLMAGVITSCNDELNLSGVDQGMYETAGSTYVALKNTNDPRPMRVVELSTEGGTVQVNMQLSNALAQDYSANITVDQAALTEYNLAYGTTFEMFPASDVALENASATVTAGQTKSAPVNITLTPDASLTVGTTYALPITFDNKNSDVKVSTGENTYMFFVKYTGDKPNVAKASGIETVFFFEVNDVNPLNAGEYTLKNSGKPFADRVVLFAANINYNTLTGRVYILMNPQVTAILNNRDKYIKPLQDKGIKVDLGLLGNHDISGLANLSDATIKDYVAEIKSVLDAYGLDGIDFDDEYSDYPYSNIPPGFTSPSNERMAKLVLETKLAMPDKNVGVYYWGMGDYFPDPVVDFNGVSHNPGDFIDMTYEPQYSSFNSYMVGSYLGMTKAQVAPYSRKLLTGLSRSSWDGVGYYTESSLQRLRDEGYGGNMLYDMRPMQYDYVSAFNDFARILYDDEIVFSGTRYDRDY